MRLVPKFGHYVLAIAMAFRWWADGGTRLYDDWVAYTYVYWPICLDVISFLSLTDLGVSRR